ncbi:uncharacterized protein LOC128740855 [Sabethes cyaneus]|uniref:uncharacterized protein LOC128740855 n=1 Tax=Sabethes cyaneus TaxID=53552 RepID=UPI00237D5290|nr:uncharacterized protein LOC128740855 [Sabethes cyaneus]
MDLKLNAAELGLTDEDVDVIVKRYLQEKRDKYNAKFRVLSFEIRRLSEEPIGYLGDHYFLNVVLREKMVHYSEEEEEYAEEEYLSFFMKILPEQVPKLADYVREMGCFKKEIQLYTYLIPRLQDVTIGMKPFAPRAYLTKDEKLLVFENLRAEGYRMVKNNKSLLDFAHLEVALKAVAKLHAASLVLEERTKQPIAKLYSGHLNENVYIDDEKYVRKTNLENAIKALSELIKRIDKYKNSDRLDYILEKFPQVIRKIYDFAKPSTVYRNVFNHGDLWNNNLMFKYEDTDKPATNSDPVPVDVLLVDYQFSRLAPPAYDVMSLIMLTTLSEFRNLHLERLKEIYYDALGALLAKQSPSLDVEKVLPKTVYFESCQIYHLAGLIESCMYFHWPPQPDCYEIFNGADWYDESRKPEVFVRAAINGFERYADYRHRISDMITQIVDGTISPTEAGADGQCVIGERRRRKRSSVVRPNPFDFPNLLLRDGSAPLNCVMIDFQIARYSPPAYDVMSLLNTTTTSAFRTVYQARLVELYYEYLRNELEWFQIDVEGVFPGDHYRESCEEYKLAGLIDSILFRHLTLLPSELVSECKECPIPISFDNLMENSISWLSTTAWDTSGSYRFVMEDLLADLVDSYILDDQSEITHL